MRPQADIAGLHRRTQLDQSRIVEMAKELDDCKAKLADYANEVDEKW
jgi:hypothetical protein